MSAVERFLGATGADVRPEFRSLLPHLKAAKDAGRFADLVRALRLVATPTLDFTSARSLYQLYKAVPDHAKSGATVRLAILGGFTTHQLRDLIELFLFAAGLNAEIYESDYDVFRQEILDPGSGLYEFAPDVVYLAPNWRNLGNRPVLSASADAVEDLLEGEYRDWALLWRTAHERLDCQILQNNFDTPPWRALDNHEMRHPAALSRYIAETNRRLAERAPSYVTIHDVEALVANAGRRAWANERFFLHAKMPCAPEYLVEYAQSVSSILGAQRGLSRKCLVLDLDNTLWGGVIGDDGLHGIVLGQGNASGEAFAAVQTYARDLARRGIILAICSKNDEATARTAFRDHPEMVLRETDIACFVANWDDKATNLRTIAQRLNIGLDALVFLDDNPFERNLVRAELPMLAVPEADPDPATFPTTLADAGYFEATTLTTEDLHRTRQYQANTARDAAQHAVTDLPTYLRSLDMRLLWRPFDPTGLPRIVQLINKTNQFNLTTRRYTHPEAEQLIANPQTLTLQLRLTDRFGDNGMISVIIARMTPARELHLDTWLMSCRVLGRTVEQATLHVVAHQAHAIGATALIGEYRPTPKNAMVRDHYPRLGFQPVDETPEGRTLYRLPLPHTAPAPAYISIEGP